MTFSFGLKKQVMPCLPIFLWACFALCALGTVPSPAHAFETSDTDAWKEDFTGTAQTTPPNWTDNTTIKINYGADGSYAYITFTTSPSTELQLGTVYSQNIPINFDQADTVDIRIRRIDLRTNCKWNLEIFDSNNDDFTYSVHTKIGANGLFSYPIKQHSGWTGMKNTSLRFTFESDILPSYDFVEVDFIRFYNDTSINYYLWQEDFQIGQQGEYVYNFWDDEEYDSGIAPAPIFARIKYEAGGNSLIARVMLTDLATGNWGKVITPGFFWDLTYHYRVGLNLVAISPNTGCKLEVRQLGGARPDEIHKIGYCYTLGYNEFDLRTLPGYPWWDTTLPLAIDIVIEGDISTAERYADIDYIGIYRPKNHIPLVTPSPTPEAFPKGGYAIPNPFVPSRGPVQFFTNFSQDGIYQVRIMNLQGRVVKTMHERFWDGTDNFGNPCEGGIYIYQISCGNQRISGKLVLLR